MSKVLVDRELLEYLADLGDDAIQRMGSYLAEKHGEQRYVDAARAILTAQPAEAEGVEVVGFLYKNNGQALTAADMDADTFALMARSDFDGEVEKLVRKSDHLAALSAVTADRDRLQAQLDDPEFPPKYSRRLIEQLRAEVEGMRKDAERYQHLKAAWDDDVLISYLDSNVHPSDWDAVIDAALAAKEA